MTTLLFGFMVGLLCAAIFPVWTLHHGSPAPACVVLVRLVKEKAQGDRNRAILAALQARPMGHGEHLRSVAQQEHSLGMHGDLPVPWARCVECEFVGAGGQCLCDPCATRGFTRDEALRIVLTSLRRVGMGWDDLTKCEAYYGVSLQPKVDPADAKTPPAQPE